MSAIHSRFISWRDLRKCLAAGYPSEKDYLQEIPVVLSASRLSQPVSETPNAITVIDRDMIVASGARNIADVFKLVPGMYVGYANGHSPIVSYRGITDEYARRMQVLVDGRSIYLPILGQVDWTELPLDIGDIERIEVIRGPSAASHGSNSVQGVISIFTRHASDAHKAEVSTRQGNAGVSDVTARFGGAGESWDYRVTLASRGDSGFDPLPGITSIPLNDDSRTQLINTRINYHPTGSDSLDIRLGYSDSTRQLGDLDTRRTANGLFTGLRDQQVGSDFEQLAWLHTFAGNSDLQLNYYHIGRNMKDRRYSTPCVDCAPAALNLIASGSYPLFEDAVVHRHDLEMQHTLSTSPDNRVVWGMGARQDSATAPNNLRYSPTWREYRLFAHDEWRITPASLINIGAMAEKNALGQTRVSPRVSYNHHLTSRDTLRASISVAYRNPEMTEELGSQSVQLNNVGGKQWTWHNISAAGGLSPEKTIAREVGYIRQLDEAGSTLDVRAFHDQIGDIIWLDLVADPNSIVTPRSFQSDFNAFHSGLEGTLNYKLGTRSRLIVNYAHQVAGASPSRISPIAAINASLQSYAYKYRETVPLNSASLLFSHDFSGGMQLGVGFYHIDPVRSLDAGTMQPLTRYLDLRVAQRFGSWRNNGKKSGSGEIALVVQNALSDHYFDYSTQTRNKRRAYLTATLEF
ncbi:MAG: hypothetical protein A2143_01465 [Gallionellales bacterium RBG_16_57_15]|nr:MAG: hypothetical protein A2143_01465 [Gallionellales bacterium RBG_16_57_15]